MKEVKSYACEICGKIYKTEEEAVQCELKCQDICNKEIRITSVDDDGEYVLLKYNYDYWDFILNNADRYYIETTSVIALDEKGLDDLIKGLKELRDRVRRERFDRMVVNPYVSE